MKSGDAWKRASIIGSRSPWGNNERIYWLRHFSCPWTCYLQICRSIATWNTTWREAVMIQTHRTHFSYPIKSCKYLKEAQVEACPAFFLFFCVCAFFFFLHHCVCSGACLQAIFVYKLLITLMTPRSHTRHFSIDHRGQNKGTTLGICVCARLRRMKEMWESTFKLPFIREDNKGSQCHYPPRPPAVQRVSINMHVHT